MGEIENSGCDVTTILGPKVRVSYPNTCLFLALLIHADIHLQERSMHY
jgi:hypothetical protein